MLILNKKSKLATIVEVGEDDVVLNCAGRDYIIQLTSENKDTVHEMVSNERRYIVAFNSNDNELLLDTKTEWDEETLHEMLEYKF